MQDFVLLMIIRIADLFKQLRTIFGGLPTSLDNHLIIFGRLCVVMCIVGVPVV